MNHGACRDESDVRACFRSGRRLILAAPSALCAPSYEDAIRIIILAMWSGPDQNTGLLEKKGVKTCYSQTDHVIGGNVCAGCLVCWIGSADRFVLCREIHSFCTTRKTKSNVDSLFKLYDFSRIIPCFPNHTWLFAFIMSIHSISPLIGMFVVCF